MRDLFKEYRLGLISWEEAYFTANNIAATASSNPETPIEETDYWCRQMESLAVDAAEHIMRTLFGYTQNEDGVLIKQSV